MAEKQLSTSDFGEFSDNPKPALKKNTAAFKMASELRLGYGDMLSVAEVAQILGCTTRTAYKLCNSGEIPTIRINRTLHIPTVLFAQYLEDNLIATT